MNARHIFKPGDRAYWVEERKWITLQENDDATYPIKCSTGTFTLDGRYVDISAIALLPLNPYDPCDPNNPKEFRNPFIHEGRLVKIGDEMANKTTGECLGKVATLEILDTRNQSPFLTLENRAVWIVGDEDITFADSLPKKKITYLWAFPIAGVPGAITIDFKRMTQEEGERYPGAKIVPDSEKEES